MKNKKIITAMLAVMMLSATASAQVFMLDNEGYNRSISSEDEIAIVNPGYHNSGEDWYVPLGSGTLLLVGLAGAYLVGKKKK